MTNVISNGRRLVALSVCALTLAACGGTKDTGSTAPAAAGGGAAAKSSSASDASRAGSIDVCALLSPADASAIARAQGLGGDDAATATYRLTTEKQDESGGSYPASGCSFTISQVTPDNTGSEATVVMLVQPATYFDRAGTKIDGLGDEAYEADGAAEVRVGDLMLEATQGDDEDLDIALYRAMIPNLD